MDFKGSMISLSFKDHKLNSVHKPIGACKIVVQDDLGINDKVMETRGRSAMATQLINLNYVYFLIHSITYSTAFHILFPNIHKPNGQSIFMLALKS